MKKLSKEELKFLIIQIIVYLGLFYILVFLILKAAGIIKTPLWIDLSPAIAAVIAIIVFIFGVFDFFFSLKNLPKRFDKLCRRVDRIALGLTTVEGDVKYLKKDLHELKADFKTHLTNHD